jgi:hypothetical protein
MEYKYYTSDVFTRRFSRRDYFEDQRQLFASHRFRVSPSLAISPRQPVDAMERWGSKLKGVLPKGFVRRH